MADTDLPDLTAKIRLDTSELEASVGKAAGIGSAIGGAVGNLAGAGISSAIEGITTFATGSVDAFAQLEDATAAAGVLFGQNMDAITAKSKSAASDVGISSQQFIDAATTFGTFGQGAGLAGKDLTDFASNLTQLSGDMASFKGTTPEQAIEAVGAALRGESEPIRAYGVLLDEATINQEAQRMGLVKAQVDHVKTRSAVAALALAREKANKVMKDSNSTDAERKSAQAAVGRAEETYQNALKGSVPALTKQQKVLATQSAIMRQTSNAQGDFARTSDSTANTQKRLAAESANAQAQLGQRLAPALTFLRVQLLAVVTNLSSMFDWFQRNAATIGIVAAVIGVATIALTTHQIAVKAVSIATRTWTAVQAALNFVMSANPIGLVVLAIAALVGAIIIAWRNSETFRRVVTAAWNGIKVVVSAVVNWFTTYVPAAWATIRQATATAFNAVKTIALLVWSAIKAYVMLYVNGIRAVIGWFASLPGLISGWFNAARNGAVTALSALLTFVKGIPGQILSALSGLGSLLLGIGGDIVQGLIDGIRGMVGKVGEAVRGLIDKIPGPIRKIMGISSPSKVMRTIGQQIGTGLELGILDGVPAIAGAAQAAVNAANPQLAALNSETLVSATGTQSMELSPASLAALARALPDVLVQVLLDSQPIAAVVDKRLGGTAAGFVRAGG